MENFLEWNVGISSRPIDVSSSELVSEPSEPLTPPSPRQLPPRSINLRDLGYISDSIKSGVVWRSSQVINPEHINELGIRTIIDLRGAPPKCKLQPRNLRQRVLRGTTSLRLWCRNKLRQIPVFRRLSGRETISLAGIDGSATGLVTERQRLLLSGDAVTREAAPCWHCSQACHRIYGSNALVYHVNMLPGFIPLLIFAHLPFKLQLKVAYMALRNGKVGRPEPVVAAAIADPETFGYTKLYKVRYR